MKQVFKHLSYILPLAVLFLGLFAGVASATTLFPNGGGTGTSTAPSSGQVLIGNSSGTYSPRYLTAGANVTITTSSSAITIGSTGGGAGGSSTTLYGTNGVSVTALSGGNQTSSLDTTYAASWSALQTFLKGLTINGTSTFASTTNAILVTNSSGVVGVYTATTCGAGTAFTGLSATGTPSCSSFLTGNQTITITGAVTGSGTTSIATAFTTSTLYALFSGSSPITFNTSTGAIGWTNSNNYITLGSLSGNSPLSYNNSTGAFSCSTCALTGTTISAGGILSGGGDLSANRTISLTTSTLYTYFSGTSPIAFNTSTGAISCPTCGAGGSISTSSAPITNTLPLWTGTSTLGNSYISQSGSSTNITVDGNVLLQVNATSSNGNMFEVDSPSNSSTVFFSVSTSGVVTASSSFRIPGITNSTLGTDGSGNVIATSTPVYVASTTLVASQGINKGAAVAVISSSTTFTNVNQTATNVDTWAIDSTNWGGQSFIASSTASCLSTTQIQMNGGAGAAANFQMDVFAATSSKPTGNSLGSSTLVIGSYAGGLTTQTFTFSTKVPLGAGGSYFAQVKRSSGASSLRWDHQSTDVYSGGSMATSSDSGANWTVTSGMDFTFVDTECNNTPYAINASAASASSNEYTGFVGFANAAAAAGSNVSVLLSQGPIGISNLSTGALYYLGNTSGTISLAPGTVSRKLGIAVSSSTLDFMPTTP